MSLAAEGPGGRKPSQAHLEQEGRIRHSLATSARSWDDFLATMNVFQSNVQRRDFEAAEAERLRLQTMLDNYLDHYLLAGKLTSEMGAIK